MKKQTISLVLLLFCELLLWEPTYAQQMEYRELGIKHKRRKSAYVPFEIAHNLIIIPVMINDSDTLRFILDTGVTHTLLTDLGVNSVLTLQYSRKIDLFGLGQGNPIEALHSYGNEVRMPGIYGNFHDLIVPLENIFQLSESLGRQVNGLMGFEVFNSFIVDINYHRQKLALRHPKHYRKKMERKKRRWVRKGKAVVIPLEVIRRKPYIAASMKTPEGEPLDIRLLVDLGASHAVSLYTDTHTKLEVPAQSFRSFLGMGLNGDIYGYTGRIGELVLGNYPLEQPVTTFPDNAAVKDALNVGNRNGSLGADVLRRFRVIFDYQGNQLILKPNPDYGKPFTYNMSGIEILTPLPGMPVYQVAEVRPNSPGEEVGLRVGDQIMAINGTRVSNFSMSDIIKMFHSRAGRKLRLTIHRNGEYFRADVVLRDDLSEIPKAQSSNR